MASNDVEKDGGNKFERAAIDASYARQAAVQGTGLRVLGNPGPL